MFSRSSLNDNFRLQVSWTRERSTTTRTGETVEDRVSVSPGSVTGGGNRCVSGTDFGTPKGLGRGRKGGSRNTDLSTRIREETPEDLWG